MSAGGRGQAVCLYLIITVLCSPTGGHRALIVDEMGDINVLTHMNNTKLYMSIPNFVSPSYSHWFAPCFYLRILLCLAVKLNLNFQQASINVLIIELGKELACSIMSS